MKGLKKFTKENKKHIRIALIIWAVIAFFVVLLTGIHNIIWALLLGLVYVGYYVLNVLGLNPVINGLKFFWDVSFKF